MPASTEPNSGIKYGWDLGESGWNLEMDSNLKKIGRVMQLSVIDRDLTAPPASPADGDRYIIAAGATGDWAGHDNKVAVWEAAASAWIVYAPFKGWVGYVEDEDVAVRYDGTAWQSYSLSNADTLDGQHAADFYQQSNILGTVSQSGGVPTGAIIERGSNSNGEYVKFADGTMICTATVTLTYANVASIRKTWTYPALFVSTPDCLAGGLNLNSFFNNCTPPYAAAGTFAHDSPTASDTRITQTRVIGTTDFVSGDFSEARVCAIGRWY